MQLLLPLSLPLRRFCSVWKSQTSRPLLLTLPDSLCVTLLFFLRKRKLGTEQSQIRNKEEAEKWKMMLNCEKLHEYISKVRRTRAGEDTVGQAGQTQEPMVYWNKSGWSGCGGDFFLLNLGLPVGLFPYALIPHSSSSFPHVRPRLGAVGWYFTYAFVTFWIYLR